MERGGAGGEELSKVLKGVASKTRGRREGGQKQGETQSGQAASERVQSAEQQLPRLQIAMEAEERLPTGPRVFPAHSRCYKDRHA